MPPPSANGAIASAKQEREESLIDAIDVRLTFACSDPEAFRPRVTEWIEVWLAEIKTKVRKGWSRPLSANAWILYESSWRLHAKDVLANVN